MWESTAEKQFTLDRRKADMHTQRSMRLSSLMRSVLRGELNPLQRTVFLGLCFHVFIHLASFPLSDWTQGPLWYACTSFSQGGFPQEGICEIDGTYYGMVSLPFLNLRNFSVHVQSGRSSWLQEWGMWSTYFFTPTELSSSLFLPLTFPWNVRERQAPTCSAWQTLASQFLPPFPWILRLVLFTILCRMWIIFARML